MSTRRPPAAPAPMPLDQLRRQTERDLLETLRRQASTTCNAGMITALAEAVRAVRSS